MSKSLKPSAPWLVFECNLNYGAHHILVGEFETRGKARAEAKSRAVKSARTSYLVVECDSWHYQGQVARADYQFSQF